MPRTTTTTQQSSSKVAQQARQQRQHPAARAARQQSIPAAVPVQEELRGRAVAPKRPAQHTPSADVRERLAKVSAALAKEQAKQVDAADKAAAVASVRSDILAGRKVSATRLESLTATQLHAICSACGKGRGARFAGHSGMVKADLVAYMATGIRPAAPEKAEKVPNPGTVEYNLGLLRSRGPGKGFSAADTAKAKSMFGATISALKAEQLRKLVAALGL